MEQANMAKLQMDKACNARSSANNERAALQKASAATSLKIVELNKFASEKESETSSSSMSSEVAT